MSARKWILICAALGASSVAFAGSATSIFVAHHEPLERLLLQRDSAATSQKLSGVGPLTISFDALGRSFELQLRPNAGLLQAMATSELTGAVVPYRGGIAGNPRSWTRLVIVDGVPSGVIWDGEELYAIEAPGDSITSAAGPIIYRLADAIVAPGALSCASGGLPADGSSIYTSLVNNLATAMAQGPGAVSVINIGAIGDFEFTSNKGSNAEAAIVTRLNIVDGIYSEQLGVQIDVPLIETFSDSNDPFGDTTSPATLLEELRGYRASSSSQNALGLTHLYTGRDLDGSTVGIAYQGVLCAADGGAGLSEGNLSPMFDSLVAAHEIGHNFNAPHDAVPGLCASETDEFIMSTTLSNNTLSQFSACSITQMQLHMGGKSCITQLPGTDISIAFNGTPPSVLLSNAATVTFDVVNNGTLAAENVMVDITLPGNVAFIAASNATGNCTNGGGTVSCSLGDIEGSSATAITVSAGTTAVGPAVFQASVTATTDDNGGNNQAAAQLTVDPAVDLIVNALASAQVAIDRSTTIALRLENASTLDASAVSVRVTLDAGLRADSANWGIGNCTLAARQVDCTASAFGMLSSSTLTLTVTGLSAGTHGYTVTLAAADADPNPANNSVDGTIRVNDPADSGDTSGGGGLGLILLLMLGLLAAREAGCTPGLRAYVDSRRP